jgi:hypothetical protein
MKYFLNQNSYLILEPLISTLFHCFDLRFGNPYSILRFNAFGHINHDGQTTVVADDRRLAAKRDKPANGCSEKLKGVPFY